MTPAERTEAAEAIALHLLAVPAVARANRVAAYLSMPSEPGTGPVLSGLHDRGIEVLVPISLDDGSLDWVRHDPAARVATTGLGIPEPDGVRLGPDALATCDVVILPALAVDHAGHRLGRGAGYYDRALANARAVLCAVVFADELVAALPHEPHDVPVHMAATPAGVFRVP